MSNLKFKLGYLLDSGEIFIQPKQRGLHQYQGRYLLENPTKEAKVPQKHPGEKWMKCFSVQKWGTLQLYGLSNH